MRRDKLNLDLLWLRDSVLEDSENLPEPEVLPADIVEDLEAALEAFRGVARELEVAGECRMIIYPSDQSHAEGPVAVFPTARASETAVLLPSKLPRQRLRHPSSSIHRRG